MSSERQRDTGSKDEGMGDRKVSTGTAAFMRSRQEL